MNSTVITIQTINQQIWHFSFSSHKWVKAKTQMVCKMSKKCHKSSHPSTPIVEINIFSQRTLTLLCLESIKYCMSMIVRVLGSEGRKIFEKTFTLETTKQGNTWSIVYWTFKGMVFYKKYLDIHYLVFSLWHKPEFLTENNKFIFHYIFITFVLLFFFL